MRLRQGLALALLVAAGVVLAWYFVRRRADERAAARTSLNIPKLGLSVQQSAHGLTIAKDSNGKPVFRLQAEGAEKLRGSGRDQLHNVRIEIFGSDGVHSDQIAGSDFAYDESSGEATAAGPVTIDLAALPQNGPATPVHIQAQGLALNVRSGLGTIQDGIEFNYLNATGSARQADVDTHAGELRLSGAVRVTWKRPDEPDLVFAGEQAELHRLNGNSQAGHAAEARGGPRPSMDAAVLELRGAPATLHSGATAASAGEFIFHLRADHTLRHLEVLDQLHAIETTANGRTLQVAANSAQADFVAAGLHHTAVSHIELSGAVAIDDTAPGQHTALNAATAVFLFGADRQLTELQARGGAQQEAVLQLAGGGRGENVRGAALDFHFAPAGPAGRSTTGEPPQLASVEALADSAARPVAIALTGVAEGPVEAEATRVRVALDARQQPTLAVATGDVRVRQSLNAGVQRTSRSDALRLRFAAAEPASKNARNNAGKEAGKDAAQLVEAIETGQVQLSQAGRKVQADQAAYEVAQRRVRLTASPGSAFTRGLVHGADADTSFTAPELVWTQQADGASQLRASGGVTLSHNAAATPAAPVVITARALQWDQPPPEKGAQPRTVAAPLAGGFVPEIAGTGVFTGGVRLVQAPNLVRADRLSVDGAQHRLLASGHVRTDFMPSGNAALPSLTGANSARPPSPVTITADALSYQQTPGEADYQGHVQLRTDGAELTAPRLQVKISSGSQLTSALATGGVRITQPGRTLTAQQALFDFATRQGRLSGGPPSIFDAEQGRISGDPLTFSLSSDEIQVGSKSGTRASGQSTIPRR